MNEKYPFIPKSNAKLEVGEFWAIKLSNGKYACGIVLDLPNKNESKKEFFAGLLDWKGDNKPNSIVLEHSSLKILRQGEAHIKTFLDKEEAILGKIDIDKANLILPFELNCGSYSIHSRVLQGYSIIRKATNKDYEILSNRSTWGYNVINILAESYLG